MNMHTAYFSYFSYFCTFSSPCFTPHLRTKTNAKKIPLRSRGFSRSFRAQGETDGMRMFHGISLI